MRSRGLNQTTLAHAVGRTQSWVSNLLFALPEKTLSHLAYREPEVLDRLLSALGWTLAELNESTGADVPVRPSDQDTVKLVAADLQGTTHAVPVYDLLSAGPGSDGGTIIEVIDVPDTWRGAHVGYEVSGDSMFPDIPNGSVVVIRQQDYAAPGDEIVCFVPDHGMLVKYLQEITPDGQYVLASYNPMYRPIWAQEIAIYGVVVEVRKRRKAANGNHGYS